MADESRSLLDDDTLKEIAARKPKLYSLNVSETDLSNDGIGSLINFENLIELSIGLEKVSDAATRIIPRSCPKLRILRIHQQSFSEGAISSMIESMPYLKELEFVSEGEIPFKSLQETIRKYNPNLHLISYDQDNEQSDSSSESSGSDIESDDEPIPDRDIKPENDLVHETLLVLPNEAQVQEQFEAGIEPDTMAQE